MTRKLQPGHHWPLGIVGWFLRRRRIARLHAELDPHLLHDIGLLDVDPRIRRNHRPEA